MGFCDASGFLVFIIFHSTCRHVSILLILSIQLVDLIEMWQFNATTPKWLTLGDLAVDLPLLRLPLSREVPFTLYSQETITPSKSASDASCRIPDIMKKT